MGGISTVDQIGYNYSASDGVPITFADVCNLTKEEIIEMAGQEMERQGIETESHEVGLDYSYETFLEEKEFWELPFYMDFTGVYLPFPTGYLGTTMMDGALLCR